MFVRFVASHLPRDSLLKGKNMLEATDGDFYSLTEKGKRMVFFLNCQRRDKLDCRGTFIHLCTKKH